MLLQPRSSVVDEWIIPYDDLRLKERIATGPVSELHKGYWHGEVAILTFNVKNATAEQLLKFRQQVQYPLSSGIKYSVVDFHSQED